MTHDKLEQILDEYLSPSVESSHSETDNETECPSEILQRYLEGLTNGRQKKRRRCISGELGSMRLD